MKRTERYTTFKSFKTDEFQEAVQIMPELEACLAATCPSTAATILTNGINKILDTMAPVCTIQNRKNYAPYLSVKTKALQGQPRRERLARGGQRTGGTIEPIGTKIIAQWFKTRQSGRKKS